MHRRQWINAGLVVPSGAPDPRDHHVTNVLETFVPGKTKSLNLFIGDELMLLRCRLFAALCALILGYASCGDRAAKPPLDFDAHDGERQSLGVMGK